MDDLPKEHVYSVWRVKPTDPCVTIGRALDFAVRFSNNNDQSGANGYRNWSTALQSGKIGGFGAAYNLIVWSEARSFAAPFLDEARQHYVTAAEQLACLGKLFPFFDTPRDEMEKNVKYPDRVGAALEIVNKAQQAEEVGVAALAKIVQKL